LGFQYNHEPAKTHLTGDTSSSPGTRSGILNADAIIRGISTWCVIRESVTELTFVSSHQHVVVVVVVAIRLKEIDVVRIGEYTARRSYAAIVVGETLQK
jgi:hypothetical protein